MRAYIPNDELGFEFQEDMGKILNYLNENGKLMINARAVESLYEGYSEDCWCAGWISVNDDRLKDFADWLSQVEFFDEEMMKN